MSLSLSRWFIAVLLLTTPALQGCALLVAGGAVGATMVAMDARDVGTQVDDNTLRVRVMDALNAIPELDEQRVLVVAFNSNILLYGQVTNDQQRQFAQKAARDANGVNRVYNQLRLGEPATFFERSRDTLLTSRIKTALMTDSQHDLSAIKVYSEKSEVFLVGATSAEAARDAIERVRNMNGVERVIDVIEKR